MIGGPVQGSVGAVRASAAVVLVALIFQFLVGMWLNLFANFAQLSPPYYGGMAGMMSFMFSGGMPILMVHMMAGYLILALSVIVLAVSVLSGRQDLVALAIAGLGSILLAGLSGLYFMYSGFGDDVYSYLMALGFIVAFAAYFAELYASANVHCRYTA